MKKLTKNEMKKVLGGVVDPTVDTVYCNDGTPIPHPTNCCASGTPPSVCACNGGFKICTAYGHPIVPE